MPFARSGRTVGANRHGSNRTLRDGSHDRTGVPTRGV
jgi:hypothetical protein